MGFLHIFLAFSSVLALCTGEIIKLESKTHILCVTDNSDGTIYVYPPVVADSRDDSILIENDELWPSDWVLKNSKEVIVPMVLDKRWENFETIYSGNIHFPSVVSLSFSTTAIEINATISDPATTTKEANQRASGFDWIHMSTHLVVNETDINNFIPFQINMTSADAYWRVHDYNLRWAESSSDEATVIPVSPDDVPCVVFYIYLCSYCIFDINVGENNFIFQGSTEEEWISRSFSLLSVSSLVISRSTTQTNTTIGQWAIDIRQCPSTKSNKTIYEVSLEKDVEPGTNRTCSISNLADREQITAHEEKANTDIFNCTSGFLGRSCDVSCKELLNSDLMYCQEHQICDDTLTTSECLCAWGYQGLSCDEVCTDGNWGFSCQGTCNNCDLCDGQTGECSLQHLI